MKRLLPLVWLLCLHTCFSQVCHAGIRSEGKYCGVVVFDRWGGCTLYSSVFVMYVSEAVKDQLLPYNGKAIEINATEVSQPNNPGDGLIQKFDYLGDAPEGWMPTAGLKLKTFPDFPAEGAPRIAIELTNTADKPLELHSSELAPTLLTAQTPQSGPYALSDGPSIAAITRESFWAPVGREPHWETRWKGGNALYGWSIGRERALPETFALRPNETRRIEISFALPAGQYDFLCGYGGRVHQSRSVASNLTAFDVAPDGKAVAITSSK